MTSRLLRGRSLGLFAAAALLGLSACADGDAVVDVTEGRPALNVLLAPGEMILPGGNVTLGKIIAFRDFDTSVPDAFARSTKTANGLFAHFLDTSSGNYTAAVLQTASRDPRLPALLGTGGGAVYIGGTDAWMPDGRFNFWLPPAGVGTPGQKYAIALVRYAVQVNGKLDHEEMLLDGKVTQPDRLVPVPNNPGGSFEEGDNYTGGAGPCRDVTAAQLTANPLVIGVATAAADGSVAADIELCAGNWYSTGKAIDQTSKTPIAPNVNKMFDLPQYNYVAVFELDASGNVNLDRPLVRRQLAPDLDAATGSSIKNNAMAPFPLAKIDPATAPSLPGGVTARVFPDTLNLVLTGMPTLGNGTYALYGFNEEDGSYASIGTFTSPGGTEKFTVTLGKNPKVDFTPFTHVVVSLEGGTPGASPAAPFMWQEFSKGPGKLAMGAFNPGGKNYTFAVAGGGRATFISDSMLVRFERVPQPPAGFHYQSYLAKLVGPKIESSQRVHAVELDEQGNATDRIAESEVGSFNNFNIYYLVLEPNVSAVLTPARILESENFADKFKDFFGQ